MQKKCNCNKTNKIFTSNLKINLLSNSLTNFRKLVLEFFCLSIKKNMSQSHIHSISNALYLLGLILMNKVFWKLNINSYYCPYSAQVQFHRKLDSSVPCQAVFFRWRSQAGVWLQYYLIPLPYLWTWWITLTHTYNNTH